MAVRAHVSIVLAVAMRDFAGNVSDKCTGLVAACNHGVGIDYSFVLPPANGADASLADPVLFP